MYKYILIFLVILSNIIFSNFIKLDIFMDTGINNIITVDNKYYVSSEQGIIYYLDSNYKIKDKINIQANIECMTYWKQNIWIGTKYRGLKQLDIKTKTVNDINLSKEHERLFIKRIYGVRDQLFVGTHYGLYKFDSKENLWSLVTTNKVLNFDYQYPYIVISEIDRIIIYNVNFNSKKYINNLFNKSNFKVHYLSIAYNNVWLLENDSIYKYNLADQNFEFLFNYRNFQGKQFYINIINNCKYQYFVTMNNIYKFNAQTEKIISTVPIPPEFDIRGALITTDKILFTTSTGNLVYLKNSEPALHVDMNVDFITSNTNVDIYIKSQFQGDAILEYRLKSLPNLWTEIKVNMEQEINEFTKILSLDNKSLIRDEFIVNVKLVDKNAKPIQENRFYLNLKEKPVEISYDLGIKTNRIYFSGKYNYEPIEKIITIPEKIPVKLDQENKTFSSVTEADFNTVNICVELYSHNDLVAADTLPIFVSLKNYKKYGSIDVNFDDVIYYTTKKGDNLWNLTEKYCGSPIYFPLVKEINQLFYIKDIRNLPANKKIKFPKFAVK